MNKKRILRCILFAALMIGLVPAAMMAAEGDATVNVVSTTNHYDINEPTTLVIDGDVTLDGTGVTDGNAFNINDDVTLQFNEGATLTLKNYTNGFVVENATVSSANMDIVAETQMDVFRLKNSGKLDLTGDNSIYGSGKTGTTNRAIVLPGSSSGQAVTLAADSTLAANNFYRAIETGGASGYTISGISRDTSVFDFSDNECGMFISYFDSNVNFKDCKLEVSDCDTSGIFMRQDNASLNGLYIDNVFINCVNDPSKFDSDGQNDIAIRFHTVNFEIKNSVINIKNAWNTGLWICDGWDTNGQKEITNTQITVDTVRNITSDLYGANLRRKAITLVPVGDWDINNCVITMKGAPGPDGDYSEDTYLQGGLNIASDIKVSQSGFLNFIASPTIVGGSINLENTDIYTEYISGGDVGVQLGQFLNIGDNVMIDNGYIADNTWEGEEHFTVLSDDPDNKFPAQILGQVLHLPYNVDNLTDEQKSPHRVTVMGGSYYSTRNQDLTYIGSDVLLYSASVPVNDAGEALTMFKLTPEAYATCAENGFITIAYASQEGTYNYGVSKASPDGNYYIWAPAATVTFTDASGNVLYEKNALIGYDFGLVETLPDGTWTTEDGNPFTANTTINGNLTVVQA